MVPIINKIKRVYFLFCFLVTGYTTVTSNDYIDVK